jgi:hypothetical protein
MEHQLRVYGLRPGTLDRSWTNGARASSRSASASGSTVVDACAAMPVDESRDPSPPGSTRLRVGIASLPYERPFPEGRRPADRRPSLVSQPRPAYRVSRSAGRGHHIFGLQRLDPYPSLGPQNSALGHFRTRGERSRAVRSRARRPRTARDDCAVQHVIGCDDEALGRGLLALVPKPEKRNDTRLE